MASIYQKARDIERKGHRKAPWYVTWIDPDGNRKAKPFPNKTQASNFKSTIEADLARGTYTGITEIEWSAFEDEVKGHFIARKKGSTQVSYGIAMAHFQRITKPTAVSKITSRMLTRYVTARLSEQGNKGMKVSPTTVNSELRSLRAVLHWAHGQGYLLKLPKIPFQKELKKRPRYIPFDDFQKIFNACHVAHKPTGLPYEPEVWWQAFLTFLFMTGWRKGETLALKRADVDLERETAVTQAEDNKSGRDEEVPLHPVVVDQLKRLPAFSPMMFPWELSHRMLYPTFRAILVEAGVDDTYGFHDLRRSFASVVAVDLDGKRLQELMRHKDYSTTQRYLDMRPAMEGVTERYRAPDLKAKRG